MWPRKHCWLLKIHGQSLVHFLQSLERTHFSSIGLVQLGPKHARHALHSLEFSWHILHALHSSNSFPGHFHVQFPFLSFSPTPSFLHLFQHLLYLSEHLPQLSVPNVVTVLPSVVVVVVLPSVVCCRCLCLWFYQKENNSKKNIGQYQRLWHASS